MRGIRDDIEKDKKLSAVQPRINTKVGKMQGGTRWKEGSSSTRVFFCTSCRSPVVDNLEGRRMHAARKPECKRSMF